MRIEQPQLGSGMVGLLLALVIVTVLTMYLIKGIGRLTSAGGGNTPVDIKNRAAEAVATADLRTIQQAILMYQTQNQDRQPSSIQDLIEANCLTKSRDPWGQQYRLESVGGKWIIASSGKDKTPNTADDLTLMIGIAN